MALDPLGYINSLSPQQIQQLYTQNQNGGVTPNLGMGGGLLGQQSNQSQPMNYAAIYQNWVNSLLQPYQQKYGTSQQAPAPQGLLGYQINPNMTPSGGGH